MSEWEPGDVALVTTNHRKQGEQSVTDLMLRNANNSGWDGAFETVDDGDYYLRSVRRVVVIDPEDAEQVDRLVTIFNTIGTPPLGRVFNDRLQAALGKYADPTPPKPEEPQGLGAVVEDADGADWHRTREGRWIAEDGLATRAGGWGHVNAVRVLSEGVTA